MNFQSFLLINSKLTTRIFRVYKNIVSEYDEQNSLQQIWKTSLTQNISVLLGISCSTSYTSSENETSIWLYYNYSGKDLTSLRNKALILQPNL